MRFPSFSNMAALALAPIFCLAVFGAAHAQSPPPRVDRLDTLAAYIETVPAARFDIMKWGTVADTSDPTYIGCAAGHGTVAFTGQGFYYIHEGSCSTPIVACKDDQGKQQTGFAATMTYFRLDSDDNAFLFSEVGGAGRSPKRAAANLRLIADKHREAFDAAKRPAVVSRE